MTAVSSRFTFLAVDFTVSFGLTSFAVRSLRKRGEALQESGLRTNVEGTADPSGSLAVVSGFSGGSLVSEVVGVGRVGGGLSCGFFLPLPSPLPVLPFVCVTMTSQFASHPKAL
ncbi:hypothetical protein AAT19DRAFT_9966 [Rhodotorula toruloides]|uniref:Uncharacterized protein n=1 Tax=Rhodotorula toruloides TaxID=5286 RepID=A0A2T0A1I3_RHOTO|nr:hypothetical protein AAT19DRAFT_9966 [Rhodotorula toruloides]